ncbi:MAG: M28 family peptidase [Flammeovirgaceae bacterium]
MKRFLLFTTIILWACAAWAQDEAMLKYAETITPSDLKKHLEILASDEYEGRETGEKGQKMAADYIYKHFKANGLIGPVKSNAANNYFQPFELVKTYWKDCTIKTGTTELKLFEDFFPYGRFSVDNKELDVVFAGYGIDTETYSDYKNLDVEGKIVVVMRNAPTSKKIKVPSKYTSTSAKARVARSKGAALIIFVYDTDKEFQDKNLVFKGFFSKPSIGFDKKKTKARAGTLFTSPSNAAKILNTEAAIFNKAMAKMKKKGKSAAGKFTGKASITVDLKKEPVQTENVLGYIEGTDKKDELLVLTAHYDHVGVINGEIHNGANDDGSGTVAVLEMAEAFAQAAANGHRPRRSILFMTVTGEEKGLLGSQYYSENPIFPLENTVVNLNTDMIGRSDKQHKDDPNYIYIIGSDMLSSDLHNLHEEIGERHFPKLSLDYTYNSANDPNRYYYRSDHYNFAKHNIPVIFYFNGTHEDYHKPTDTVDKINFEQAAEVTKLTFCTAWIIANRDTRIEVDKAK